MLCWAKTDAHWNEAENELSTRGVKKMTFYDIVMDYILMDAFEDLESPPGSVIAVIQNRWLSKGFKETVILIVIDASLMIFNHLFFFNRLCQLLFGQFFVLNVANLNILMVLCTIFTIFLNKCHHYWPGVS